MPRLARSKQCSRTGSLTARKRRSRLPRTGYLANPASLIGIPRLEAAHAGNRITFGSSALTALAQTLVEIDLATESDWIAAGKTPAALVDYVFRRFLRDHGQEIIAEHFELYLTLGESIVDTSVFRFGRRFQWPALSGSQHGVIIPVRRWRQRSKNWNGAIPVWEWRSTTLCAKPSTAGSGSMTIGTPATASSK